MDSGFGVKSDIPSTFTGERGGEANDADLLAELRAISMKNASADRFADDDDDDNNEEDNGGDDDNHLRMLWTRLA